MTQEDAHATAIRLAVAVGRVNRRLRAFGEGLAYGQLSALATVAQLGPIRPSEIARIETIAAATATRVVAELESRGLVSREPDPADGRSWLVSATAEGIGLLGHAREERAVLMQGLLDLLDDRQRAAVDAVVDAFETMGGTPAR